MLPLHQILSDRKNISFNWKNILDVPVLLRRYRSHAAHSSNTSVEIFVAGVGHTFALCLNAACSADTAEIFQRFVGGGGHQFAPRRYCRVVSLHSRRNKYFWDSPPGVGQMFAPQARPTEEISFLSGRHKFALCHTALLRQRNISVGYISLFFSLNLLTKKCIPLTFW